MLALIQFRRFAVSLFKGMLFDYVELNLPLTLLLFFIICKYESSLFMERKLIGFITNGLISQQNVNNKIDVNLFDVDSNHFHLDNYI